MEESTFDIDCFSDIYKDAYGFRPRNHRFYDDETTDDEKQEIWDDTCLAVENVINIDEIQKEEASRVFEQRITELLEIGAPDRETAVRWLFQAENVTKYDAAYGASFLLWLFNLPNSYTDEMNEMLKIYIDAKIIEREA